MAFVLTAPMLVSAVDVSVTASIADVTPPTVTVTQPIAGTTYTSATIPLNVTGTAADNSNGVGLAANSTQYSLQRSSDNKYWDGATWIVGQVFLGTTHPATTQGTVANWTSNNILPPWLDDTYTIAPRATDKSSNIFDGTSVTFSINTPQVGLVAISQPVTGTTYTSATIPVTFKGTVQDASDGLGFGANVTQFSLQRQSDNKYWNGTVWVSGITYLNTTHANTNDGTKVDWTSSSILPPWLDDTYTIQAQATDKGGTTYKSSFITFTIDNGAPPVVPTTPITPTSPVTTLITPPSVTPIVTIPSVCSGIACWIFSLPQAGLINNIIAALVAASALLLAALPALLQLPVGLPGALGPLGNLFAQFLAWLHRRRKYGIVFDSANSKPVPGAFVRLLAEGGNQFEVGKLLESKKTDGKGRYTFDVRKGFYRIEVIMPEYSFPSARASVGYRGEIIEATDKGLVYPDVPIDNLTPGAHQSIIRFHELGERIQQLRIPLSVVGTIFAASFFIERGAPVDYAIMVLYAVFWTLELFNWLQGREIAYVTASNRAAPLTILRLYDSAGRLRTTRVSDLRGRYAIFTAAGTYLLDALNRAYDVQSNEIKMKIVGIIPKHIRLQRIPSEGSQQNA
jgi:hypothetical protein